LPDVQVEIEPKYNPCLECPPVPPPSLSDDVGRNPQDILNEWGADVFAMEVKKCGEILQCHHCQPVCHKYGNDNRCRFLFPHEIVEALYFDSDNNAIVFICCDGNVNYFNPYILVFCRHNHDLKCILSGKGAKAAMFYISDYITKMDTKTYEMLSLLSRAVAHLPNDAGQKDTIGSAKTLFHKCLSQFSWQQQIHAQQAARYIRGFDDGIPSHLSVPMMSSLLLDHVKCSNHNQDSMCEDAQDDDDDIEHSQICVTADKNGNVAETNQIHHYVY